MKKLFISSLLFLLIGCNGDEDKTISGECQVVEIFVSGEKKYESCYVSNLYSLISPKEITIDTMESCEKIKSSTESRLQKLQEQKKIPKGFLEAFFNHARATSLNPRIRIRRQGVEDLKKTLCLNETEIECKEKIAQGIIPLLQEKCLNFIEQGTEAQFTECFLKEFLTAGHQALRTKYNCK